MSKRIGTLAIMSLFTIQLLALSVTPNPSVLLPGPTNVTFTFDCNFTGIVLIDSPPNGITYPGLTGSQLNVSNGSVSLDIMVQCLSISSFDVTFTVVSSSASCAAGSDTATATIQLDCYVPPNDECVNAIPLTLSTNSCSAQSFDTTNATNSGTDPSCNQNGYPDLWYTFTANNATVTLEYSSIPGFFGYLALYDDCPMAGANLIACEVILQSSMNEVFTGLTVGTTYTLQMMHTPPDSGTDQMICLHSTTPQPTCQTNIVVSDAGPVLPNGLIEASSNISTSSNCTVTSMGTIFSAGQSIDLNSGFDSGLFDFEAVIGGCTP